MATTNSNINFNAINETFPVAGSDNSSQGFRDNFSAIKTGLMEAKTELDELFLNAARLDQDCNFNGNNISNANFVNITHQSFEMLIDKNFSQLTQPVLYTNGTYQTFIIEKDITLLINDWPLNDNFGTIYIALKTLEADINTYTVVFSAGSKTLLKQSGFPNSITVSNDTTKIFKFSSVDGQTVFANYVGNYKEDALPGTAGVNELSELSDVSVMSIEDGDVLYYNGTKWINNSSIISDSVSIETSARISANTTLQNNINSEITARIAADNTLQTNIDAESTARAILENNINSEITARVATDSTLQNSINSINSNITSIQNDVVSLQNKIYNGTETISNGQTISLTTIVSIFGSTAASTPLTALLPAGTTGQIKTLIMTKWLSGSNMVVTVSNAGWKTTGLGTITFGAIGETCTLQYINNKWYVINNNGTALA